MVWTVCMVHKWRKKIKKNFVPYMDGMDGLYHTQMVHRWYIDGMDGLYGA